MTESTDWQRKKHTNRKKDKISLQTQTERQTDGETNGEKGRKWSTTPWPEKRAKKFPSQVKSSQKRKCIYTTPASYGLSRTFLKGDNIIEEHP